MEGFWLVSYIFLWVITLLLVVTVLTHSRMLGLLHYRFGPANAKQLADGPELGTELDKLEAIYPSNENWNITFPQEKDLILIFISPQCSTCNELLPHVKDFSRNKNPYRVILISTLDDLAMNRAYVGFQKLENFEFVISEKLATNLNIEGTPYALYINQEGKVLAKGLVNNYENLIGLTKTAENLR